MTRKIIEATVAAGLLVLAAGTSSGQCPGDANGNGFVNFADYGAVAQNFGQACSPETRFVDNLDGTITDRWTGLMWEKKVGGNTADVSNIHHNGNGYVWAGECTGTPEVYCQRSLAARTACAEAVEGDPQGCGECIEGTCEVPVQPSIGGTVWEFIVALNATNFAGYADWRVPTFAELSTLLLPVADAPLAATYPAFNGASCAVNCLDMGDPDCSCSSGSTYWSSTTVGSIAPYNGLARGIGFGANASNGGAKSQPNRIRAVRNAPAAPTATPTPAP